MLRHRNAVFNRIYYSTLALYKAAVPVPFRWLMELNLLLMVRILSANLNSSNEEIVGEFSKLFLKMCTLPLWKLWIIED